MKCPLIAILMYYLYLFCFNYIDSFTLVHQTVHSFMRFPSVSAMDNIPTPRDIGAAARAAAAAAGAAAGVSNL